MQDPRYKQEFLNKLIEMSPGEVAIYNWHIQDNLQLEHPREGWKGILRKNTEMVNYNNKQKDPGMVAKSIIKGALKNLLYLLKENDQNWQFSSFFPFEDIFEIKIHGCRDPSW